MFAERIAIVIDRTVAFYSSSLLEAVILVFAAYYCFNIQYPECVAATLEFIQRYAVFSFYSIKIIFSCAYYFFNSRRYFLSNIHIIHDDSHIHVFLQDNSLFIIISL